MNKIFLSMMLCLSLFILPAVSAGNLIMSDLEGIDFNGLTVQDYSGSSQENTGFAMAFEVMTYIDVFPNFPYRNGEGDQALNRTELGMGVFMGFNDTSYMDKDISIDKSVALRITTDYIADIKAGDFITLTYDKGKTIDVLLPEIKDMMYKTYYIAIDGSVYHDGALTMPVAMKLPISGNENIMPDVSEDYVITLLTEAPDSDYSDGTYTVKHANWGLMNSNQEIIEEGVWERIYGDYQKNISIIIPQVGEYMLFAVITQVDMVFDDISGNWTESNETLLVKEVLNVNVKHPITEPTAPTPLGFTTLLNSIAEWLSGLWTFIFG